MKHDSGDVRQRQGLSYRNQAILKGTWALCLFFTAIFILVSIITADDNEKSDGGFRVVGFTGIWTAFMMTAIMSLAAQVVFDEWHSPFVVGSLIGASVMLAELQFVMMIVYFVFADHARDNGHDVVDSDRALGAFSLFTMLTYLLLAGVLAWLKDEICGTSTGLTAEEEERMMDRSDTSAERLTGGHYDSDTHKDKDQRGHTKSSSSSSSKHQYSIEDPDEEGETDVVDVDLEETETF